MKVTHVSDGDTFFGMMNDIPIDRNQMSGGHLNEETAKRKGEHAAGEKYKFRLIGFDAPD